jgi:hypothetical protein
VWGDVAADSANCPRVSVLVVSLPAYQAVV